jgi:hypothetical protein
MPFKKTAPLRFLSIPNEVLHHARARPFRDGEEFPPWLVRYDTQFYSSLGARIIAGGRAAAEVGEMALDWPDDRRPVEFLRIVASWEKDITWLFAKRPADIRQGLTAFELLNDLSKFRGW